MLFVYPFGVPAFYVGILYRHRYRLRHFQRAELNEMSQYLQNKLRRKSAALLYRLNSSSPECGESGPSLLVLGGDCSPPGCRTTSFSTK